MSDTGVECEDRDHGQREQERVQGVHRWAASERSRQRGCSPAVDQELSAQDEDDKRNRGRRALSGPSRGEIIRPRRQPEVALITRCYVISKSIGASESCWVEWGPSWRSLARRS